MNNLIGQSLGRYHILEQLGEGGMATVYKAYDTRLERHVAVKVILPQRRFSEKFLKRFEREAKALAKLSHPNIVKVLDYGEHEGLPYLVMEYLPGGTLKQRLEERAGAPMHWRDGARLLIPIARALEYAHQQKIVHRDVKPSNILLTQSGEPMLSDFGIAKMLETEETVDLTGTGVGIGTPEYMAPEQGLGQAVDHRADIYSLGVVFYELVTGRKPYRADTPMAVLHKQLSEPLPRPAQFVHGLPEAVERVMIKSLAKKPENRYQEMNAFASALGKIAQGQRPAIEDIPIEEEMPSEPGKVKSWLPWLAGGMGIAVFCIVGITAIVLGLRFFNGQPDAITPTQISGQPFAAESEATPTRGYAVTQSTFPTTTPKPERKPTPTPQVYYPLSDCVASRLRVGDSAFVDYGGGLNKIRSFPDLHPNNTIGKAEPGEVLIIVGGPECNDYDVGWLLWEVQTTDGLQGWTPETHGQDFFLIPITAWQACPGAPNSRLQVGDTAFVASYPASANTVRESPGSSSSKIGSINPNEKIEILAGPQCGQNKVWWQVRSLETGITGWTAEGDHSDYWLVPIIPRP